MKSVHIFFRCYVITYCSFFDMGWYWELYQDTIYICHTNTHKKLHLALLRCAKEDYISKEIYIYFSKSYIYILKKNYMYFICHTNTHKKLHLALLRCAKEDYISKEIYIYFSKSYIYIFKKNYMYFYFTVLLYIFIYLHINYHLNILLM